MTEEGDEKLYALRKELDHSTYMTPGKCYYCNEFDPFTDATRTMVGFCKGLGDNVDVTNSCNSKCICPKCCKCICAVDKSKRNGDKGASFEFDGSKCLSINCINPSDRATFLHQLNKSKTYPNTQYIAETYAARTPVTSKATSIEFPGSSSMSLTLSEPSMDDLVLERPTFLECVQASEQIESMLELNRIGGDGVFVMSKYDCACLLTQRSMLLLFLDSIDKGEEYAHKALEIYPSCDAYFALGCAQYCQREYEQALETFLEGLRYDISSETTHRAYKVVLARLTSRKDRDFIITAFN